MAFTLTITQSGAWTTGGGTTSAVTTTGANLIVCGLWWHTGSSASFFDSKTNSWTQIGFQSNGFMGTALYYCIGPTTGSGHTFRTNSNFSGIGMVAVSAGGATPTFDRVIGSNSSTSPLTTGSLTPVNNSELYVTAIGSFNGALPAMPVGYTYVGANTTSAAEAGAMGYKIGTTTGAENPSWTTTGTNNTAVLGFFKLPTVATGNNNFFMFF